MEFLISLACLLLGWIRRGEIRQINVAQVKHFFPPAYAWKTQPARSPFFLFGQAFNIRSNFLCAYPPQGGSHDSCA